MYKAIDDRLVNEWKKVRKSVGLNKRRLALLTGIAEATISRIEKGETGISSGVLSKFCKATGCKIVLIPQDAEEPYYYPVN